MTGLVQYMTMYIKKQCLPHSLAKTFADSRQNENSWPFIWRHFSCTDRRDVFIKPLFMNSSMNSTSFYFNDFCASTLLPCIPLERALVLFSLHAHWGQFSCSQAQAQRKALLTEERRNSSLWATSCSLHTLFPGPRLGHSAGVIASKLSSEMACWALPSLRGANITS